MKEIKKIKDDSSSKALQLRTNEDLMVSALLSVLSLSSNLPVFWATEVLSVELEIDMECTSFYKSFN